MVFNSVEFFVFFAVVYAAYRILPFRGQNIMLLVASYIFYGWWDWRFLFLMAFSTVVDFWIGLTMDRGKLTRRDMLVSGGFLWLSTFAFLGLDPAALFNGQGPTDWMARIHTPLVGWACLGVTAYLAIMFGFYQYVIRQPEARRRWLCLMTSVVTQIGLLGTFKYFNFFADSLVTALHGIGIDASSSHLEIILPVGISFYTFQSLSYAIDIYRNELKPTNRFFDFALFVSYFPQLVAGPINRARHLIPQLANPRTVSYEQVTRGIYLILFGIFKKVAVADGVAPVVDKIYNSSGVVSWADIIVATVLFAVQIYCDFSGYTDVARGVSKLFGVDLTMNFNQPYFSKGPSEFWQRWHISLSTWLRDYLYIPLGGNRGGFWMTCRNLMITMLLGGLWHGAAWNYVLWGFFHGSLLVGSRLRARFTPWLALPRTVLATPIAIGGFFAITCYGWLLFRARSFDQVATFTTRLVTDFGNLDYGGGAPRMSALLGIVILGAVELLEYVKHDRHYETRLPKPLLGLLVALMIVAILMGMNNEPAQFIYFQF